MDKNDKYENDQETETNWYAVLLVDANSLIMLSIIIYGIKVVQVMLSNILIYIHVVYSIFYSVFDRLGLKWLQRFWVLTRFV